MISDNLGDWRIDTVVTVAKGDPNLAAGTPVRLMSVAKHKRYKHLSFVTPSATALALNVAINAAAMAESLRPRLLTTEARTHTGERGFQVRDESLGDLYVFFEQSMVAVTLSFQALEVFANAVIGRRASGDIRVKRKGGIEIALRPIDAERQLSTEEKLAQVLPTLLHVPSPVGKRVWQRFKRLKGSRDGTVHLKSNDMYTRNQIDRESLFFYFFNTDCREHPDAAIRVISHYFAGTPPRWLSYAKALADKFSVMTSPQP